MAKHDSHRKISRRPLQHASPSVLKRMKRGGNAQIFLDLIAKARRIVPGASSSTCTSFICRLPGETEMHDVPPNLDVLHQSRQNRLAGRLLTYSDEEGAKAFELAG